MYESFACFILWFVLLLQVSIRRIHATNTRSDSSEQVFSTCSYSPPTTITTTVMPPCTRSSEDTTIGYQCIVTTVSMESCNRASAVMESCSGASTDALTNIYVATIASVTIIIIALIVAALIVIYMRMKRQVSSSRHHNMIPMNGLSGKSTNGFHDVQESVVGVRTRMDSHQQDMGVQNQAYDNAVSHVCPQHTYASLEPPPISMDTHPPASFCKQGQLENPTYFAAASSLGPTSDQQIWSKAAPASDYLDPVATLRVPVAENKKMEAASSHSLERHDHTHDFDHDNVASQNSEPAPLPQSGYEADGERNRNDDYAILDTATNRE